MEGSSPPNSFIVDACALVNLAAMEVLDSAVGRFKLVVPQSVIEELQNTAIHPDYDGELSRLALERQRQMEVVDLESKPGRDWGEADCQRLAMERNLPVITDDVNAGKRLDAAGIPNYFSVFLLFLEVMTGRLSHEEACRRLEKVRLDRSWKENTLYQTGKRLLESLKRVEGE